jgi:hypothetical protein
MHVRSSDNASETRRQRRYALLGVAISASAGTIGVASLFGDILGPVWSSVVIVCGALGAMYFYRLFRIFDRRGDRGTQS